ncbi:hypothetical protein MHY1_03148 [Methylovirgula sp. HY1]|nr:hypothetical protein MHY1_03148 [Methylovirgula sp. HY1]
MKMLTNIHAAFAPPRGSRMLAAAPCHATSARSVPVKASVSRPRLQRRWASDAAGHLVCAWSEASPPQDQSTIRRGRSRAGAAIFMAA